MKIFCRWCEAEIQNFIKEGLFCPFCGKPTNFFYYQEMSWDKPRYVGDADYTEKLKKMAETHLQKIAKKKGKK